MIWKGHLLLQNALLKLLLYCPFLLVTYWSHLKNLSHKQILRLLLTQSLKMKPRMPAVISSSSRMARKMAY